MSDFSNTLRPAPRRFPLVSSLEPTLSPLPRRAVRRVPLELVPRDPAARPTVLLACASPDSRARLATLLGSVASFRIPDVATGPEALHAIRAHRPDVAFLEADLPGLSAFEVLAALDPAERPAAVVLAAHERDAARAFEADAADYLVPPISPERFAAALARATRRLAAGRAPAARRPVEDWLIVKKDGRSLFVRWADVDWIESARNNVILHVGAERYVHRETTSGIEKRLHPNKFLRIHRSAIVRIDRIREMTPWFNGDVRVTLKDGTTLTLSESYRSRLKRFRPPQP